MKLVVIYVKISYFIYAEAQKRGDTTIHPATPGSPRDSTFNSLFSQTLEEREQQGSSPKAPSETTNGLQTPSLDTETILASLESNLGKSKKARRRKNKNMESSNPSANEGATSLEDHKAAITASSKPKKDKPDVKGQILGTVLQPNHLSLFLGSKQASQSIHHHQRASCYVRPSSALVFKFGHRLLDNIPAHTLESTKSNLP